MLTYIFLSCHLLNAYLVLKVLLVESIGPSMQRTRSSTSWTFFLIYIFFISYHSNNIQCRELYMSEEDSLISLLTLVQLLSLFPTFSIMCAIGLSYPVFVMFMYVPSAPMLCTVLA